MGKIGFEPDIYSIWRGDQEWEQKQINRFHLSKLFGLLFWLPYWILKTFRISGSFKTFMGQSMSKFTKLERDFSRTWICVSPSTRNKTKKIYSFSWGLGDHAGNSCIRIE